MFRVASLAQVNNVKWVLEELRGAQALMVRNRGNLLGNIQSSPYRSAKHNYSLRGAGPSFGGGSAGSSSGGGGASTSSGGSGVGTSFRSRGRYSSWDTVFLSRDLNLGAPRVNYLTLLYMPPLLV